MTMDGTRLDPAADARQAFDIIAAGGICLGPNDGGYALWGSTPQVYRRSITGIDFLHLRVLRIGNRYELIRDVLRRHFDVNLPADPGYDALPSGHLAEFELPVLH
ncbi:hypothetical protein ACIRRA_37070 [Nocardia sp. NPDC101769]|uniref:hypothetical protein n=1 Tax=Nocardia sp. NPDC101769 TaxID=3364333 RepID=UPI0037F8E056